MKTTQKMIGIALAIPIPFLVLIWVWFNGVTRIVHEPKELHSISRTTIQTLPGFLDKTLDFVQRDNALKDKRAQAWLKAFYATQLKPSELLSRSGFTQWAQDELIQTGSALKQWLDNPKKSDPIRIQLQPVKQMLSSRQMDQWLLLLMKHMPLCNASQLIAWRQYQLNPGRHIFPPACRLSDVFTPTILKSKRSSVAKMPRQVTLLPGSEVMTQAPWKILEWLPLILILLPAFFVLLSSGVGGTGFRGFLQWSGFWIGVSGLLTLPTPFLLKDVVLKGLLLEPWNSSVQMHAPILQPTLHRWLFQEVLPLFRTLSTPFFSSVETTSLFVCILGGVLFALGFMVRPKAED